MLALNKDMKMDLCKNIKKCNHIEHQMIDETNGAFIFRIEEKYGDKDNDDLRLVIKNGLDLEFVDNQYYDLCLAAVKQNGRSLEFVKHQTEKICIAAVKSNEWAILYVKKPTIEMYKIAVKQNIEILEHIKNKRIYNICKNYIENKIFE